jgi:TRAP transporter TAXI family solute receptor
MKPTRLPIVLLLAVLATACTRGPDAAALSVDVQARLDALFGRPVLLLRDLNRQGSAPYASTVDGARQAIVYFNARLEFIEPYDASDWNGLSPQLIATALGATDEGVIGLSGSRMQPGSELRAYGSMVYRRDGKEWRPTDFRSPQAPAAAKTAAGVAPSVTDELVSRLAQLVDTSPLPRAERERIVSEELDHALENIQLRLDAGTTTIVVATGPVDGEYSRLVDSLGVRLGERGLLEVAHTEGSVANAFLVDQRRARFGLVQSDVAQAAVGGEGVFEMSGPLRQLRAVASLFPEPMHVVVRADSGIDSIAGLAGRRVSLGALGSGTRYTALQVLGAHGLGSGTFTEVMREGPLDALTQLADGSLDAVVEVVSAPWGELARMQTAGALRLVPLDPAVVDRLAAERPALLKLTIPARTYAWQDRPVPTVAATALLVANAATPDAVVTGMLDAIFAASDVPGRGVRATRLSRARAQDGVSIPMHDGAVRYFQTAKTPP